MLQDKLFSPATDTAHYKVSDKRSRAVILNLLTSIVQDHTERFWKEIFSGVMPKLLFFLLAKLKMI